MKAALCGYRDSREANPELGPPPSVDEAANTLMTRLGFLLGEKVSEGPAGAQYSMEEQDDSQTGPPLLAMEGGDGKGGMWPFCAWPLEQEELDARVLDELGARELGALVASWY
ncbi:hypothetical protein JZ751_013201 [Albula glossodonta]|uniref:Uncharacterized protein n=1 Tax=Albula glossodonta TaxID=121402 RepID=A0A8T2NWZ8_9TELE|nr:hypothetical protein JZ751_013201 [Albula glossodonta]